MASALLFYMSVREQSCDPDTRTSLTHMHMSLKLLRRFGRPLRAPTPDEGACACSCAALHQVEALGHVASRPPFSPVFSLACSGLCTLGSSLESCWGRVACRA